MSIFNSKLSPILKPTEKIPIRYITISNKGQEKKFALTARGSFSNYKTMEQKNLIQDSKYVKRNSFSISFKNKTNNSFANQDNNTSYSFLSSNKKQNYYYYNNKKLLKKKHKHHHHRHYNLQEIPLEKQLENFEKRVMKTTSDIILNPKLKNEYILNGVYGTSEKYRKTVEKIKTKKFLSLDTYQDKLLKVYAKTATDNENYNNLAYNLNEIKNMNNSVKPLPIINIGKIKKHFTGRNEKNDKLMTLKEFLLKSTKPKDGYEEEELLIKKMMSFKSCRSKKRNKIYDTFPVYLKDLFEKKSKFKG